MRRTKRIIPLAISLLTLLLMVQTTGAKSERPSATQCPIVKIEAKRLPDLNIARAGISLFYANNELVVVGGHTGGFVPTPTAEYLKDGKWHQLQMVYNHDNGLHTVLRNGKVLLAGGSSEPIGIGQTYVAELYDPKTHTFDGFNSMEHKRTLATALEIDSGRVVIAGNWYHQDAIEVFDCSQRRFLHIRDVETQRAIPLIIQTAPDDALIFGSVGVRGDTLASAYAYQLKGDSIHIPLLDTWHPIRTCRQVTAVRLPQQSDDTYLFPVYNDEGQVAVAKVEKGVFSLLPTTCPIPMQALGHEIEYNFDIIADPVSQRAYLIGGNRDFHQSPGKPIQYYILAINYAEVAKGKAASLTLYYTQLISEAFNDSPIITPEGNIVAAGGLLNNSNFTPSRAVWLFPVGTDSKETEASSGLWMWTIPLALLLIGVLCYLFVFKKQSLTCMTVSPKDKEEFNIQMMSRITKLIESEKLYLDSELKVTDIADALMVHRNVISDVINSQRGTTFTQFVNDYRVEHAKEILRKSPKRKLSTVSLECGFANEQSFFRTFKSFTGKTPKEWIQDLHRFR